MFKDVLDHLHGHQSLVSQDTLNRRVEHSLCWLFPHILWDSFEGALTCMAVCSGPGYDDHQTRMPGCRHRGRVGDGLCKD